MWAWSKEQCLLEHRLCSRIKDDQPQGYAAFDWESILHGNTGKLRDYKELAVLPDKIASYLYEFHADLYASHSRSPLPVDRSNTNVHGILKPQQVFFWVLWHIWHIWHLDCLCYIQSTSEHSVSPSLNWRQWPCNCTQHASGNLDVRICKDKCKDILWYPTYPMISYDSANPRISCLDIYY